MLNFLLSMLPNFLLGFWRKLPDEYKKEIIDDVVRSDYYHIRVGDYWIGLSGGENVLVFARVLHRKEIYRYFP